MLTARSTTLFLIILGLLLPTIDADAWAGEGKPLLRTKNISTVSQMTGNKKHASTEGKPLIIFAIKNPRNKNKPKHTFYIQGGLHGNERLTSTFVVWLANRYSLGESLLNDLSEPSAIDFLSAANPDGLRRNYRYNARAVNLNRNFPVLWGQTKENPGQSPLSESESLAIEALFKKRKYLAAIDVHGYINWLVAPSPPTTVNSDDHLLNLRYQAWIGGLRNSIGSLDNYELKTAGELGDGGAFEDWAFWKMGVFAVCLEMAHGTRFAKLHATYFSKGTDTFLKYERFVYSAFERAIELRKKEANHLSFSRKNPGKAKAAGKTSAFK